MSDRAEIRGFDDWLSREPEETPETVTDPWEALRDWLRETADECADAAASIGNLADSRSVRFRAQASAFRAVLGKMRELDYTP